jgi:predicted PurR-regulated permease PerM
VAGYVAKALGTTTSLVMGLVEVLLLSWLALASGDLFYEKLMRVLPHATDKRVAAKVASESERAVGGYVLATALINAGQAVAVGLALWLIKMPDAVLWAMACFVFEFIPYLGGTLMVGLLAIVGLTTFDSVGRILAAPGAYLAITTLQNNLVSPLVYGRRLQLNPVAVLVAVMFWWTLWGVAGAFLAVPIIAAVSVISHHVSQLRPLGEFLGD